MSNKVLPASVRCRHRWSAQPGPRLHDGNALGVADSGQAVRDNNSGAPMHAARQRVLHQPLTLRIQGTGRLQAAVTHMNTSMHRALLLSESGARAGLRWTACSRSRAYSTCLHRAGADP